MGNAQKFKIEWVLGYEPETKENCLLAEIEEWDVGPDWFSNGHPAHLSIGEVTEYTGIGTELIRVTRTH